MKRYWIGVVSKDHVESGRKQGIAQLGHGKRCPLARLKKGDYLIYYSPKVAFEGKEPLQSFTALGVIEDEQIAQVNQDMHFAPYRRKVNYLTAKNDAPIRPLIPSLGFIRNKTHWGAVFRFGLLEINKVDFKKIANAMGVDLSEAEKEEESSDDDD